MNFVEYETQANKTAPMLNDEIQYLLCAAMGACGEAGEFADTIKKTVFQGHALDRDKIVEELGDIMWYIALGAMAVGLSMDEIAEYNVHKLRRRYPNGFDSERSIHRVG